MLHDCVNIVFKCIYTSVDICEYYIDTAMIEINRVTMSQDNSVTMNGRNNVTLGENNLVTMIEGMYINDVTRI